MSRETLTCGDIGLWEKNTRKTPLPGGGVRLTYTGDEAPGAPIEAELAPGWKPRTAVSVWYNHVVGVINERQNKQEAAAAQRAEAPKPSGEPGDPGPRIVGASGLPIAPAVPDSEASVEGILEAKISALSGSLSRLKEESAAAARALADAEQRHGAVKEELRKAINALKLVKGGGE